MTETQISLFPVVAHNTEYRKSHLVSLMQHSLSLTEAKCVTVLMYLAAKQYEKDPSQIMFYGDMRSLSLHSGITYRTEALRQVLGGLMGKVVVLNYIGKHGELREKKMAIIAETDVASVEGNVFTYQFPETIRKALMEPDYYTLIRLIAIPEIASKYTYAIYEYCKSYVGIGKTEVRSIEGWREFLCVGNDYPAFTELERNIFKRAEKEINTNNKIEIKVGYRKIKVGRTVTAIQFTVEMKTTPPVKVKNVKTAGQEITVESLMGLLPNKLRTDKNCKIMSDYLMEKGAAFCIANIQYTYENCLQERSFSTYLVKALMDNWGHEVCKRIETDKMYRSVKGGRPRISDLDPIADRTYAETFEIASDTKKEEIQEELDRRLLSGSIRKILPIETKIRQAMQYQEIWLI